VALAPPYVKAQCIAHGQVTYAHPVISLMTHTGVDIEWIIPVTSTPLRGVNDLPIKSTVGPIDEEQCQ
jgi:hypothetical protein